MVVYHPSKPIHCLCSRNVSQMVGNCRELKSLIVSPVHLHLTREFGRAGVDIAGISHLGSVSNHIFASSVPTNRAKPIKGSCSWVRSVRIRAMSASLSSSLPLAAENENEEFKLLTAVNDEHEGVIVEMKEHMDSKTFDSSLRASLEHWRQQAKRGIWIKIPIELVNLVETAVKHGFRYHHAEPNYLMLVYWIPEGINPLPANASHRVGVGAFVMNDNREVLVVQEKNGWMRGKGIWKYPTGVVDEGEDICAAAIREVKEETAIDTEFVEVLSFRQTHKSFFGKSDLFFLCMLRPLSFDIVPQESEIEAAQWMPCEEYAAQPFVQKNDFLKYLYEVCLAKKDEVYSGFSVLPTTSNFSAKNCYLYLNTQDLNTSKHL